MNDVKDLMYRALEEGHGPDPATAIDPTADILRGRRLLQRRRLGFSGAALATAALVPVAATFGLGGAVTATGPTAGTTVGTTAVRPTTTLSSVALVAYHGDQPPGYRVAEIPAGWVVQGSNPQRLTIAPKDAADQHADVFEGKLVVMLESPEAGPLDTSRPGTTYQEVDGRPGVFRVDPGFVDAPTPRPTTGMCRVLKPGATKAVRLTPGWKRENTTEVPCADLPPEAADVPGPATTHAPTQVLTYLLADGRQMVVQAPVSLGWDAGRLARFAAGVEVLPAAEPGRG